MISSFEDYLYARYVGHLRDALLCLKMSRRTSGTAKLGHLREAYAAANVSAMVGEACPTSGGFPQRRKHEFSLMRIVRLCDWFWHEAMAEVRKGSR